MTQNQDIESNRIFVEYLNHEIDEIHHDIKMPGWTNWAILAALATIGWFIIIEVENNVFNLDQTYLLFIILSMIYTIGRELYDHIKPNQSNKKIRYFTLDVFFQEKRFLIVINIIQACFVIFVVAHFSTQAGIIPYYLSLIQYGFIVISPFLVLAIEKAMKKATYTNFYVPDPTNYNIPFRFTAFSKRKRGSTNLLAT